MYWTANMVLLPTPCLKQLFSLQQHFFFIFVQWIYTLGNIIHRNQKIKKQNNICLPWLPVNFEDAFLCVCTKIKIDKKPCLFKEKGFPYKKTIMFVNRIILKLQAYMILFVTRLTFFFLLFYWWYRNRMSYLFGHVIIYNTDTTTFLS